MYRVEDVRNYIVMGCSAFVSVKIMQLHSVAYLGAQPANKEDKVLSCQEFAYSCAAVFMPDLTYQQFHRCPRFICTALCISALHHLLYHP